jgi:hypothetical protein
MSTSEEVSPTMKTLISRCALRRTIGLVIDAKQIALSLVVTTPVGRREAHCELSSGAGEPVKALLAKLLGPWTRQVRGKARVGPWVQLAVPESQVFQAVVPITQSNRNAPAPTYFLEAVQTTNVRAEDRIIDLLKLELGKQPLACVTATPRGPLTELIEKLRELGARIGVVEPAPAALFRAGVFHRKPPRHSKLLVRFFLGCEPAIGIVGAGPQPLFWHTFSLPRGEETPALLAAFSTLWMMARHARIPLPIDTVIVHGRPELVWNQDPEALRQRTGAQWIRCPAPDDGPAAAALGAGLADPVGEEARHDLARDLKPPVALRDIFPWAELALYSGLATGTALFLNATAAEVDSRLWAARAEQKTFAWLKHQTQSQLDTQKKDLEERTKVIAAFQGSRIQWSLPLRTLAAAAPKNTVITMLQGDAAFEMPGKSAQGHAKRQLLVNFATPVADEGGVPSEINDLLTVLRGNPVLTRHFPVIEVSGLRNNPAKRGGQPFASYSVVCLPKTEPTKPPAPKPAGKT